MQLADLREAGRAAVKESRGFCERGRHGRPHDLVRTKRTSLTKAPRQHRIYNDYSALWLTAAPSRFRVCLMTGGA